jgi:hypothetical protein
MIFRAADKDGALESASFLGQKRVIKKTWGFAQDQKTYHYSMVDPVFRPKFTRNKLWCARFGRLLKERIGEGSIGKGRGLSINARRARLRQPEPRRERVRALAPSQSNRFVGKPAVGFMQGSPVHGCGDYIRPPSHGPRTPDPASDSRAPDPVSMYCTS